MRLFPPKLLAAAALASLLAIPGCKAKKVYPDPLAGWHNPDYSTVFGRIQLIAAKNPDNPPVWVIRFGLASDPYHGELAMTPPERLTGYSGGEEVEVRGNLRPDLTYPDYAGTWYEVHSIRMWSNKR